jgi:hypothetical protein
MKAVRSSRFTVLRVVALVAMATASFAMMGASGCGTALHKASVAAGSIGASAQTAATINHDLIGAQVETADEGAAVAGYILKVARANDVFVHDLQAAQASGTQLTSQQILADFQVVVTSASDLENAGVLGIKNPQAKAKFAVVIADIRAQVAVIQALLGGTSQNHPSNPWAPIGGVMLLGLAVLPLTPAQVEELIALAVDGGSALAIDLMKLRGETDPQLQAGALAADAAAEAQAIADGAKE